MTTKVGKDPGQELSTRSKEKLGRAIDRNLKQLRNDRRQNEADQASVSQTIRKLTGDTYMPNVGGGVDVSQHTPNEDLTKGDVKRRKIKCNAINDRRDKIELSGGVNPNLPVAQSTPNKTSLLGKPVPESYGPVDDPVFEDTESDNESLQCGQKQVDLSAIWSESELHSLSILTDILKVGVHDHKVADDHELILDEFNSPTLAPGVETLESLPSLGTLEGKP